MDMTDIGNKRVVDYEAIRKATQELETLALGAKAAGDAFKEACKSVAAKAHIDAAVLSAFVKARISDKPEKKRDQIEQLSLLFEEVDE